jgi:AIPR protein
MGKGNSLISLFKEQLENESANIAKDRNLAKRGDYLIWWYFLKLWGLPPSDIEEALCDDGNDLGLDAVYIDEDNIVHFYQFKNPHKMDKALPEGEVDSVISGLHLILNKRHKDIVNEDLKGRLDEIYQTVPSGYRLHLVTSGTGISRAAEEKLDSFVDDLGGPSKSFFTWNLEDLTYLQDIFYRENLPTVEEPIRILLEKQGPYQVRAADHDCYIFHLDGTVLAQLYEQHGEQLLQQNIRVYQGDKATNASIKQTSIGDDSDNFFHYNNGVTFLCETAGWDQFISTLTLDKGQIVNGGQTIRVLYGSYREEALKGDVLVPVRVITSQGDKQFGNNVAVNLNNQTRLGSSFLRSNDPRVVQLANSLASLGWYLERREDEVRQLTDSEKESAEQRIGHPLDGRVIGIKEGTQAYVSTFFREPELAKKNVKRMFLGTQDGGYFDRIFNEELSAEKFVLAQQIKWYVDDFVKQFMSRKRRKARVANWEADYEELLGEELMRQHKDVIDQVIPQSSIFLSAILFEEQVRILEGTPEELLSKLNSSSQPMIDKLSLVIEYAKENPQIANKSWPTLLKSQPFFENVVSYLKGKVSSTKEL